MVNVACGQCQSGCECSSVSAVILPGPVHEVLSVTVDGVELESSEWWLQDHRRLIRIGDTWPTCQDFNLPSGEGTWSVLVRFGSPVPEIGIMAVTELANEIALACAGSDECLLPPNTIQVTRGGVTYDTALLFEYLEKGRTGMRMCDLFLSAFNPYNMQQRSRVYTPDR